MKNINLERISILMILSLTIYDHGVFAVVLIFDNFSQQCFVIFNIKISYFLLKFVPKYFSFMTLLIEWFY